MWMLLMVPVWFVITLVDPFGAGALTLIPALGTVCLVGGVLWCIVRPTRQLLWLAVPFLASMGMLLIATLLWEQLETDQATAVVATFLAIEVGLIGFVTYRLRHRIGPALLLGVFSSAYALFAGFVTTMAMTGSWL